MPMARLSAMAHQRLQQLAARTGKSQQEVLDEAIELRDRKQFFDDAHREYEALRADPEEMAKLEAERGVWDVALDDGAER